MKEIYHTILRKSSKVLLWTAGIWAFIIVALQIVLSTPLPTKLINKYAGEYFDGKIEFESISASMFRNFPGLSLSFDNLIVAYSNEDREPVVTDMPDTLGMLDTTDVRLRARMRRFEANANVLPFLFGDIRIPDVRIDSMAVAGRMGADTVLFGLDMLDLRGRGRNMAIHAEAKTYLATHSFGRLKIPVSLDGKARILRDTVPAFGIRNMNLNVASLPISADARIRMPEGKMEIKGRVDMNGCKINDVTEDFVKGIIPEIENLSTDAEIYLHADIDGAYDFETGALPALDATLEIPESGTRWKGLDEELKMALKAALKICDSGQVDAYLEKLQASTDGLELNLAGNAGDMLGADPSVAVDGNLHANLDTLSRFVPDTLGVNLEGRLDADIKGTARLSQLSMYNFSSADLQGLLTGKGIVLKMPSDTIDVRINSLDFRLGPEEIVSRRDSSKTFRLISVTGQVDTVNVVYGNALSLQGNGLEISAKNADMSGAPADTARINPFSGRFSAERLFLTDAAGSSVRLDNSTNRFSIFPKKGYSSIPVLNLTSSNGKITLRAENNRFILTDADIKARAAMNTVERKQRAKAFMDSLARKYPDVPRDSLFSHIRSQRAAQTVPDWLQDEDFRKQDINLRLDESMAKYFREWDLNGSVKVRTGIAMTPYLPLRNILRGLECNFTNDKVAIDSFKVMSGKSAIAAKGALTGLKRTLLGRGSLKFDLDITSDGMDANELLTAFAKGSEFNPEAAKGMGEVSDAEFLQMVVVKDTAEVTEAPSLLVIPSNLNADISLNAENIKYTDLDISKMTANLKMKERCLQITDTKAISNMGDIGFEGFYATKSKKDLSTGFSLNFKDITAEKVISLIPAADTLIPMIKSFKGLLNCEIAGTASLDTNMNIVMPSVNGVMRISGKDLEVSDNEMFRSLAKLLLFKNKKEGRIETMTVEGVLKDNTLEVFPFVLKLDRYTLAMSGVQNMDMSFRYHVSVIKSPLFFKLGVDLSGKDFDNMKFKIGKAKYKSAKVPAFSSVIDTTKISLLESIRNIFSKGVDAAVRENQKQKAIEEHKKEIGYVKAVDQELEALSEEEQKQMEEEEAAVKAAEENTDNTENEQ